MLYTTDWRNVALKRYKKPWSMGRNGFMVELYRHCKFKGFPEKFTLSKLFPTVYSKKIKQFPAFLTISSQLCLCKEHKRSLQLKSVATLENHEIGPKSFLRRQKDKACLKQSILRICICMSSLWQCKLLLKELYICQVLMNEYLEASSFMVDTFKATTFFQSGSCSSIFSLVYS